MLPRLLTLIAIPWAWFAPSWSTPVSAKDAGTFGEAAAILSRHCLGCHNDHDQEGGFSLQSKASLNESGFLEHLDDSNDLLQAVMPTSDERPTMPKDADPLSPAQIKVLREWIEAGAIWPEGVILESKVSDFDWWSLRPLAPPEIPASDSGWGRNPVDAFIEQKWSERGLAPSLPADRRTLIRRLTFDLTGLPPTPNAVRHFLADTDPLAYEKLVDRLLASPGYGERWARHWLDVVKYADTCGYDKDKLRPHAWPYRDYVIRSLNQDKTYSRFVQEQVAGDVLFPGEPDGILGLGFVAAGPWDFIGHVEVPESKIDGKVARNLDRDEMVTNTMNTFCSVTIQCARCHHHKFDPITQEDYYSLQAIFAAVDRAPRPYELDPQVEGRRRALQTALAAAEADRKAVDAEIAKAGGNELAVLRSEVEALSAKEGVEKVAAFGYHSAIANEASQTKWVEVDLGQDETISEVVLHPCHDDFAGIGSGFGFPVRYHVDVAPGGAGIGGVAAADAYQRVADFTANPVSNPGLSAIHLKGVAKRARFVRITAAELAPRKGDYIFSLSELQVFNAAGANVARDAMVRSADSIEAPPRWSRRNLVDGQWPHPRDQSVTERLANARAELAGAMAAAEANGRSGRRAQADKRIKQIRAEMSGLPVGRMVYAAATQFPPQSNFKPTQGKPRPVYLLHRGDVNQPRREMQPALLPLSTDGGPTIDAQGNETHRRAELAKWLTRRDHPLVWRSIVNRVWQYHFGVGLVATPNDFGRMGALPTHPDLLDWLAIEFRDRGESLKHLHRLIVTSNVYRQSSATDREKAAIDGSNQYLWRMNRRRLAAEEIRDAVLTASGRRDDSMGGPGYYLFALERPEHSPHYEYHKFDPADPTTHRRTIYRFIVRSQPDPFMSTLDCADSSQSTPRRVETLTSLQALSLMNNRFNLEMASRFAQRLRREARGLERQVDHAMMLAVARRPDEDERKQWVAYAHRHGLENFCRMLFNLSEFVFVD